MTVIYLRNKYVIFAAEIFFRGSLFPCAQFTTKCCTRPQARLRSSPNQWAAELDQRLPDEPDLVRSWLCFRDRLRACAGALCRLHRLGSGGTTALRPGKGARPAEAARCHQGGPGASRGCKRPWGLCSLALLRVQLLLKAARQAFIFYRRAQTGRPKRVDLGAPCQIAHIICLVEIMTCAFQAIPLPESCAPYTVRRGGACPARGNLFL